MEKAIGILDAVEDALILTLSKEGTPSESLQGDFTVHYFSKIHLLFLSASTLHISSFIPPLCVLSDVDMHVLDFAQETQVKSCSLGALGCFLSPEFNLQ